ncbi:MAG TPA: YceI family protein [Pedobacter sp.]|uniref:YceI family protein n=1 Tax=Pedobacter sp. TaxID=1411316 RepID=UPI002C40EFD6|nr:YceI family protein [Pedobacter sp.]HMI04062.1 YceI family protein [Pedobacter sp.]
MSTTKWKLDPVHSEIGFKVRHMMLTNVSGKFQNFSGMLESAEESFDKAIFSFKAEVNSITTGNEERDEHLLSPDFFNAEAFPEMLFDSTSFTKINDKEFELLGDFTIHGIMKALKLEAAFEGINKDPWGNTRAGFTLNAKMHRKDWNLNWNSLLETGGMMVAEEVALSIQLQFIKE